MVEAVAHLVPLTQVPPGDIEALLDLAFGPSRHARTAYRVRAGTEWLPGLSFAALDADAQLAGSIQVWPAALTDPDGRAHPMLMVGPVAVQPAMQGLGFGRALLSALIITLDHQDGAPALPQVLIGDPQYYRRFGFSAEGTGDWRLPGPFERHRLLVRTVNHAVLPQAGMLGPWRG